MRILVVSFILIVALAALGSCTAAGPAAGGTALLAGELREASSLNWGSPVVVDNRAWGGNADRLGLAFVGGNPAAAYTLWNGKTMRYSLCYVRASNASGSAWGSVKTVATMPSTQANNTYVSICVANGNPALCYLDQGGGNVNNHELRFVRATDATGSRWGSPVTVDSGQDPGAGAKMIIVNGNPAITYTQMQGGHGKYVRALDANGTTWGEPQVLDATATTAFGGSLAIVNGCPAVSYQLYTPTRELRFIRALDANGSTWGVPQTVASGATDGRYIYNRVCLINNAPAIVFSGSEFQDPSSVYFVRALDADGTVWPTDAVVLDAGGSLAHVSSVTTVGGLPAVACMTHSPSSGSYTLSFVQSLDSVGSAWAGPVTLAQLGAAAGHPALVEGAAGAGIAYYDSYRAMNYIRGQ